MSAYMSAPLRVLVFVVRPGDGAAFASAFAAAGFAVETVEVEDTAGAERAMAGAGFDLALADVNWLGALDLLTRCAPEVPVMAFSDGPEDSTLSTRWIRDGALDCLFSKESEKLTAASYHALYLRRQNELRRQREPDLVETIQVFRAVLQGCPYGIVALDQGDRVMFWSAAAAKVTGWREEAVTERRMPGVSDLELRFLGQDLANHEYNEAEFGWRRRDGSPYVARVRSAPLLDNGGKRAGSVLVIADVTNRFDEHARLQTVQAEVESSRKEVALLEAAPDAVIEVDPRGLMVLVNQSCERMFGYQRSELLGRPVEMLMPASARPGHERQRERYAADPVVRPMGAGLSFSGVRKDGTVFPVEITLSPLQVGPAMHTAAVVRDVTERERLARAVSESAEQSRLLFEQSPVAAWVLDPVTQRFLAVNQEALRDLGYDQAEFLAMPVGDLLAGNESSGPARLRRSDGQLLDFEIRSHELRYQERPARLVVAQNVTEQRRAQEAIEEARLRAERASQAKSEFLANMSHELRSPLHTIIGFTELLVDELEGPLNEKQKRFAAHIQRDSQHLLSLINDILDLSKIEAGRIDLRTEVFGVRDLVDEALAMVRPQADAKNITLANLADPHLQVEADRLRSKQVLLNLLTNAVKFTGEGGRVQVEAEPQNGFGSIAVVDNGMGVPVELRERIFDVFYQGPATSGGTGLGLAIARRLVEGQGGSIWIEAAPGGGSRFAFTLPRAKQATIELRDHPLVLALEDDPSALDLLREYLEPEGFELVAAATVRECLVKALELRPDAIVLDLYLPEGSGWDALAAFKNLKETTHIPVLVTSVAADATAIQRGAFASLTKPVARDILLRSLRRALVGASR